MKPDHVPFDVKGLLAPPYCPVCGELVAVDDVVFRYHHVYLSHEIEGKLVRVCGYHGGLPTVVVPPAIHISTQRVNLQRWVRELLRV